MTASIRNDPSPQGTEGEAFEDFYRREFKAVVALAYALSGSRMGAEDLAQEAFIAAHQKWDKVRNYEKPGAFVRRVVANMAVSAFRTKAAEAKALMRLAGQWREGLPDLEPEDEEFWNQVRSLPAKQAQAVTLFYLDDLPVLEIADVLNCSPATAKVHLFRGRKALAAKLGVEVSDAG
ncbi:MAG TPA: SigE family RNA polymerase sigma factor [Acidimicrobiia bacterium]|nr:SigE family RNA polymerase sigma factor [Acidimicrobiia bacterium]